MYTVKDYTNGEFNDGLEPLKSFLSFAVSKMAIEMPFKVCLMADQKNKEDMLGKTAAYVPGTQTIYVYVDGRKFKDILRSVVHEITHHVQHQRGDLGGNHDMSHGYAQRDPHLRKMEEEAYQAGLLVRDWEDNMKVQTKVHESKKIKIKIGNKSMLAEVEDTAGPHIPTKYDPRYRAGKWLGKIGKKFVTKDVPEAWRELTRPAKTTKVAPGKTPGLEAAGLNREKIYKALEDKLKENDERHGSTTWNKLAAMGGRKYIENWINSRVNLYIKAELSEREAWTQLGDILGALPTVGEPIDLINALVKYDIYKEKQKHGLGTDYWLLADAAISVMAAALVGEPLKFAKFFYKYKATKMLMRALGFGPKRILNFFKWIFNRANIYIKKLPVDTLGVIASKAELTKFSEDLAIASKNLDHAAQSLKYVDEINNVLIRPTRGPLIKLLSQGGMLDDVTKIVTKYFTEQVDVIIKNTKDRMFKYVTKVSAKDFNEFKTLLEASFKGQKIPKGKEEGLMLFFHMLSTARILSHDPKMAIGQFMTMLQHADEMAVHVKWVQELVPPEKIARGVGFMQPKPIPIGQLDNLDSVLKFCDDYQEAFFIQLKNNLMTDVPGLVQKWIKGNIDGIAQIVKNKASNIQATFSKYGIGGDEIVDSYMTGKMVPENEAVRISVEQAFKKEKVADAIAAELLAKSGPEFNKELSRHADVLANKFSDGKLAGRLKLATDVARAGGAVIQGIAKKLLGRGPTLYNIVMRRLRNASSIKNLAKLETREAWFSAAPALIIRAYLVAGATKNLAVAMFGRPLGFEGGTGTVDDKSLLDSNLFSDAEKAKMGDPKDDIELLEAALSSTDPEVGHKLLNHMISQGMIPIEDSKIKKEVLEALDALTEEDPRLRGLRVIGVQALEKPTSDIPEPKDDEDKPADPSSGQQGTGKEVAAATATGDGGTVYSAKYVRRNTKSKTAWQKVYRKIYGKNGAAEMASTWNAFVDKGIRSVPAPDVLEQILPPRGKGFDDRYLTLRPSKPINPDEPTNKQKYELGAKTNGGNGEATDSDRIKAFMDNVEDDVVQVVELDPSTKKPIVTASYHTIKKPAARKKQKQKEHQTVNSVLNQHFLNENNKRFDKLVKGVTE